jgi:predicted lipid-binding transport protein (Tim44 family)
MTLFGSLFGLMIFGLIVLIVFRIFFFAIKLIAIGLVAVLVLGFVAGNHLHCSSDSGSFDCQSVKYEHVKPYNSYSDKSRDHMSHSDSQGDNDNN